MPRKNRTPSSPRRLPKRIEAGKVRYASKAAAERQIREQRQYDPDVTLSVYQSPYDSGWYLTSRTRHDER